MICVSFFFRDIGQVMNKLNCLRNRRPYRRDFPFFPWHPKQFCYTPIGNDELPGAVVHQEALRHVVQRRVEPQILLPNYFIRYLDAAGVPTHRPHERRQAPAEQQATYQYD